MNWKVPVAWSLVAGLGGLTMLIAPSPTTAQPTVSINAASHDNGERLQIGYRGGARFGTGLEAGGGTAAGAPGGQPCHYDNLRLGEPAMGLAHAQKSVTPIPSPFYAETADDFFLTDQNDPAGLNGCVLDQVQFAVTHEIGGISPQNWNGVKITVYQDRGNVCSAQQLDFPCQRNPAKGPGGYPLPSTDAAIRDHRECCANPDKAAIVCELKVPMSDVTWVPIVNAPAGSYEITVSGLSQYNCVLEKNKKYWMAPAPVMDFSIGAIVQGFIYLWTSQNVLGRETQVISDVTGVTQWSTLQTQLGWFQSDLYLGIWATKEQPPVEICQYENLRLNDAGIPVLHAQKSGAGPANQAFYGEVADDFILSDPNDPNGANGCVLDRVRFAVMHDTPGISPVRWNGVKITIYQDRGNVCSAQQLAFPCQRNPGKGPGGYPVPHDDASDREHQPCCSNPDKAAIVCELKVPMSKVTFAQIPGPAPDSYDITVSGLTQFNCVLEKNKKYWIAPVPEMEFFDLASGTVQGATYLWSSPNSVDNEAQAISANFNNVTQWSGIQSQLGWFDTDIYLGIWANKDTPSDVPCHYENLRVGQDVWPAQKDLSLPFYAETADDFILSDPNDPDGDNPCQLEQVTFAVYHNVAGSSPANWAGIKITVYQDRGNVCAGQQMGTPCLLNPDKGPAGYPVPSPDGTRLHLPCCMNPDKPAIVCELKIPMSNAAWVAIGHPVYTDLYEVTVSGLEQYGCLLEKNKKYWMAPAPEMEFAVSGQTFLLTSPNAVGQEAQSYAPELGIDRWSLISTQLGGVETDLYLAIWASKFDEPVIPCVYENLRKSASQPSFSHSQKSHDTSIPLFYAETADDFVLTDPNDPQGDNNCRLDEVEFSVWHDRPGISPANWNGVKITIYQDRGVVCLGQPLLPPCSLYPDKGPGGFPAVNTDPTVREHESCCSSPVKDAIVCELKIPMSDVIWTPQTELPDLYHILVPNLASQLCHLTKGKKYWIAPAPEMDFTIPGAIQGFTYLMTSPNPADHSAQVVSDPLLGHPFWETLSTFPGIDTDLFLAVRGIKTDPCPWDCADGNRIVGINDFLALLAQWNVVNAPCDFNGGGVDINDFLKLLAHWGPCP